MKIRLRVWCHEHISVRIWINCGLDYTKGDDENLWLEGVEPYVARNEVLDAHLAPVLSALMSGAITVH